MSHFLFDIHGETSAPFLLGLYFYLCFIDDGYRKGDCQTGGCRRVYGGLVGRWWVGARPEAKSGGGCSVFVFTNFLYSLCFSHEINFFNSILLRSRIE